MRTMAVVTIAVLVAGCEAHSPKSPVTGRVPYLMSRLSAEEADQALRKGMSVEEVGDVVPSIPVMSMWWTSYNLSDGWLTCRFENGKLKSWTATRTQRGPELRVQRVLRNRWKANAKTKKELLSFGWKAKWKWISHDGLEIGLAADKLPWGGEPYVNCYGYVYNVGLEEWRRFMALDLRNVFRPEFELDRKRGIIRIVERANSELQGKTIFQQSVTMLSDDRRYLPRGRP